MTKNIKLQERFYTKVDIGMVQDENLTPTELKILIYMKIRFQFFDMNKMDYYESVPTIAENSRTDKKTVSRAIQKFKKFGYMDVLNEKGKSNKYILLERDGVPF